MGNKSNKILHGGLALVVYIAIMVGFGFILDLFWKIEGANLTMFWIATACVCVLVAFYVILMLCKKKDAGVGVIQLMFTLMLSGLPLLIRAINMIPVAGIYISGILLFIVGALYLITMIALGFYATEINNNSDNRPGGKEI